MASSIKIKRLSIGKPKTLDYGDGKQMISGIQKQQTEAVFLSKNGFESDDVADKKNHGGPDRAVCLYPYEHYAKWEEEFGNPLPPAAFGENVTVTNMLEKDVHIGDIFQLGEAIIQITQARNPCSTIDKHTGFHSLLNRIVETGYTGYLARVLHEGIVRADGEVALLDPHPDKVSVLYVCETYFRKPTDKQAMERILAVDALADEWKGKMRKRLEKLEA
ncbi:MOSC domain-containing protein [Shouchella clausii]|uniref:MOSC domain-containing protein n=1 Tax=Shouchella clausii TaxID=79880 RepID=UPI000BA5639B|nr:MOSC domain-containing protein [Shouchella clausii]PAD09805.1 MOSC domain-containing protein [Shouchella clausii]PAE84683.1 MOSC domain-containing protein [Shouchella clausii]PAF06003.1 MOSC domain-containing protein [Shouchella clausii]